MEKKPDIILMSHAIYSARMRSILNILAKEISQDDAKSNKVGEIANHALQLITKELTEAFGDTGHATLVISGLLVSVATKQLQGAFTEEHDDLDKAIQETLDEITRALTAMQPPSQTIQ